MVRSPLQFHFNAVHPVPSYSQFSTGGILWITSNPFAVQAVQPFKPFVRPSVTRHAKFEVLSQVLLTTDYVGRLNSEVF